MSRRTEDEHPFMPLAYATEDELDQARAEIARPDIPTETNTQRYVRFRDVLQVMADEIGEDETLEDALIVLDREFAEMREREKEVPE